MGIPNLIPVPRGDNPEDVRRALALLARKMGQGGSPTFGNITVSGLTASKLIATDASKLLVSTNAHSWISGTTNEIDVANDGDGTCTLSLATGVSGSIDHNALLNTHNLTTDISHATITGAHNLTTDIDHNQLTNTHNLTTDIDHDALTNFVANEHIDWTGATQDFLTSGFGTINGLIPGADDTYDLGSEEIIVGGAYELKDSQDTYNTGSFTLSDTSWAGQTITPAEDYSIAKVELRLFRSGAGPWGTVTVSIRATSGGVPSGEDLVFVTVDCSGITTNSAGEIVEFVFVTPLPLSSGVKYAVVFRQSLANTYLNYRYGNASGYAGGNLVYSSNSGSSWSQIAGSDVVFYCYSSVDTTEYARWQDLYLSGSLKDGTNSLTIVNLQAAYDHIHNLTTDIDHDALTNFVANEHIDWTSTTQNLLTTGTGKFGGAANAVQLIVKANAAQGIANSLVSFQDSSGTEILRIHSDGVGSIFIGTSAGIANNYAGGGAGNVFIGNKAGEDNTTGINNVFMGNRAGANNLTGNYNFALGTDAMLNTTVPVRNVAIGVAAIGETTAAVQYNVAIGDSALRYNDGDNNTGIGYRAGYLQQTGDNNVFIGYQAGYGGAALYSASGIVCIGYQAGYSNQTSNRLYIDNSNSASPLIYGEFDNDLLKVNGYFEVNQASTTAAVPVAKLTQADVDVAFIDYVGTTEAGASKSLTSWTVGAVIQGYARIKINGTDRWMPFYAAPVS